jgi:hypothetical protein
MLSKIKYWIPVFLLAIIIFWLSSRQTIHTSEFFWQDFMIKKSAHFIEYALLAILVYRALKNSSNLNSKDLIKLTLLLTILYAISDEIHQTFVPSRTGKVRDVIIDGLGATTAIYLISSKLHKAPQIVKKLATQIEIS